MQIVVRSLKYDRRPHIEWPAEVLLQNEEVILCIARPGTICVHHGRETQVPFMQTMLGVFPVGAWFNTLFTYDSTGDLVRTYCNVSLPPEVGPGMLEWVDLDLDVILHPGLKPVLDDEEEFARHRIRYGYPPDLVSQAERTARNLLARAERVETPFLPWSLEQALHHYGV